MDSELKGRLIEATVVVVFTFAMAGFAFGVIRSMGLVMADESAGTTQADLFGDKAV